MTEYCEICESVARASSSCPATDIIVVCSSLAIASSSLSIGYGPSEITSQARASSTVESSSYATANSSATASSEVFLSRSTNQIVSSQAVAKSQAFFYLNQLAESSATASSNVVFDTSALLESRAKASSNIAAASAVSNLTLDSRARARSNVSLGLLESVSSTATASSTVFPQRVVTSLLVSSATASSAVFPQRVATLSLDSSGRASSTVTSQLVANTLVESSAHAYSDVFYKDEAAKAWVMNTETTAVSIYDNFGFESLVSWRGREFAIGPDGITELTGSTDDGLTIKASMGTGFMDFGADEIKRLDNVYFGYTSDNVLNVQVEVYESGKGAGQYVLEARGAEAPRNSRVTPGKGGWGRYWRLTISNVAGASFVVHDMSADIAVGNRRI